jgi:hypothetical protein
VSVGIEQGALPGTHGVDSHEVAISGIQDDRTIPDPGQNSFEGRQQPAMVVPDEDNSVRHCCEAASRLFRGFRRPIEVPQVLNNRLSILEPLHSAMVPSNVCK